MKMLSNPEPNPPGNGQHDGGEDFPPRPDGRSTKALARRLALFRLIAESPKPLKTTALQSHFAREWGITPRVVRDDLMVLRGNPAYRFWKIGSKERGSFELVWTARKRDARAGSVIHSYGGDQGGDDA